MNHHHLSFDEVREEHRFWECLIRLIEEASIYKSIFLLSEDAVNQRGKRAILIANLSFFSPFNGGVEIIKTVDFDELELIWLLGIREKGHLHVPFPNYLKVFLYFIYYLFNEFILHLLDIFPGPRKFLFFRDFYFNNEKFFHRVFLFRLHYLSQVL